MTVARRRPAGVVLAAGVAVAGLAALALGRVLGLLGAGPPVGVGDNGDGFRLFCTAGLRPDTPEQNAAWRGVVVTTFTTGHPPCRAPLSSGSAVLAVATSGAGPSWSLVALAWTYVGLTALGAGLAAAALAAVSPGRVALVVAPLLPLAVVPWWTRFDLSTYAEPAGLLGAVWLLLGLLVVAGTPRARCGPRLAGLALVAVGGLVAATAKPGFVPLGVLAVVAAASVTVGDRGTWRSRAPGAVAAVLVVALSAVPVVGALRAQDRTYAAVNAHNLIFTLVLPERGPAVLGRLGLPPEAASASGESWYWAGARDVPGWDAAVGVRPGAARADAVAALLADPLATTRALVRALAATLRPALPYLPATPRGLAAERDEVRTIYPETGPVGDVQRRYLDAVALPWLPTALVVTTVLAGVAAARPRRRGGGRSTAAGLVVVAATAALGAVGIVAAAVLGDGFYELTKHVWLASYLLAATVLVLVTAAAVGALGRAGIIES